MESPKQAGVIYAGTDDGVVHMTRDGGKTWANITSKFPGVPKNAYVSRLTASAHEVNVVYASFDNHRNDDYGTYVYASVDGGNNFRSIGEGIPKGHTVTSMVEDPKNANVLYSGTEFGLFVSPDRGGRWMRFKSNLPTVPIHEIVFHPRDNDMIVATHGRSIWILDDATPIQQINEAMKADAYLFDVRAATQFNQANDRGFVTDKPFFGKNPTYGAAISYYLAKESTNVALRIRDGAGTQVREITGNDLRDARRVGVNRVNWDLRHQPIPPQPGQQGGGGGGGGGGGFGGGGLNGPNVLPGEYRVTLVVEGKDVSTKTVRVNGDPEMSITDADRRTLHDTALGLHEMQRTANAAADAVTALGTQMQSLEGMIKNAGGPSASGSGITDVNTKVADLRRRLGIGVTGGQGGGGGGFGGAQQNVRGQLGQLKGQMMGSTSLPTAVQIRTAADLREDLAKVVQDTNELINAVPGLYEKSGAAGLKPTTLKPINAVSTRQ